MLQEECINSLMDLGLTLVQAKIYLALSKLDNETIKTISKNSNLARQDIYRIMPSLERLGLVEKIIDKPTKYKATPIKIGFSTLLQQRIIQDAEVQKKTNELLKILQEDKIKKESTSEDPQFIITSEISLLFKKLMKSTQDSKISIDSLGNWASFEGVVSGGFKDFKKALERGVKIRSITEKPADEKTLNRYVKKLRKNPLYELRFIPTPAPSTMVIIDKKELNIGISNNSVCSLWSNNPAIVGLAINYFEDIWHRARKDNTESAEIINETIGS
jgi:sugar-specific transcriptional regulator TrmB